MTNMEEPKAPINLKENPHLSASIPPLPTYRSSTTSSDKDFPPKANAMSGASSPKSKEKKINNQASN